MDFFTESGEGGGQPFQNQMMSVMMDAFQNGGKVPANTLLKITRVNYFRYIIHIISSYSVIRLRFFIKSYLFVTINIKGVHGPLVSLNVYKFLLCIAFFCYLILLNAICFCFVISLIACFCDKQLLITFCICLAKL